MSSSYYKPLLGMPITYEVDLGVVNIPISAIKTLERGSIIDLQIPCSNLSHFYINNRLVGNGEIMVHDKNLAIRINEIFSSEEVVYNNSIQNIIGLK